LVTGEGGGSHQAEDSSERPNKEILSYSRGSKKNREKGDISSVEQARKNGIAQARQTLKKKERGSSDSMDAANEASLSRKTAARLPSESKKATVGKAATFLFHDLKRKNSLLFR